MRAALVLAFALPLAAAAAPPALTVQPFISGLSGPLEVVNAKDGSGRLYVLEQVGRVRVVRNGHLLPTPFLDLSGSILAGGEEGLLGIAFHPSYAANGRFYVYYTRARPGDPAGDEIVIERFNRSAANPDVADPSSGSILLVIEHPSQANHQSGKLAFGPDGYLYASVGDGGGGGDPFMTGQNLAEFRGKILRLDVDGGTPYAIPPTNPFFGSSDSTVHQEIWDYGLRNAWRYSFDRLTGDLLIADVGQNLWEEVDFEPAGSGGGRNYGWSVFEATHCFNPPTGCTLANHTPPVIEYHHDSAGGFSITGGYVYRGTSLPALYGYYVYGDYVDGHIWAALPGSWVPALVGQATAISAFGEDEDGELYICDLGAGTVGRLTPAAPTPPRMVNISTRARVLTGEDVAIGGFVIGGSTPKTVAITATGPSLAAQGIASPLANPQLTIVRASDQAVIATNDNWPSDANAQQLQDTGFAPASTLEPGVLMTLPPGAYTAIVQGAGGGTGVSVVGVFEVDHPEVPLANIATRAQVLTGDDVMIGGFIVQGSGPRSVVVTATGPSLASSGVANPLGDPTLTLMRSSDQAILAANDNWQDAPNAADIQASGFAPPDARESAIMMTLAPGAYTAIVRGASGATGVAVVGVYQTP